MAIPKKITKRFNVKFENPQVLARELSIAAARLGPDTQKVVEEVGLIGEGIFARHALKSSGKMARGVTSSVVGGQLDITTDPVNPSDGFHYVGITRFGHRSNIIKPRSDRRQASIVATKTRRVRPKSPRPGTRPALAIPTSRGLIFRHYVHGFHPVTDWAEDARRETNIAAERLLPKVGDAFLRRVSG